MSTIAVVVLEPGAIPHRRKIDNGLAAMQAVVGGYIEEHIFDIDNPQEFAGLFLYCNEEGRFRGLRPCIRHPLAGDIVGPVFVMAIDGAGDGIDMNEEQIALAVATLTRWRL